MSGWAVTEWSIAATTIITAIGLIWQRILKPMRDTINDIHRKMEYVQGEMSFNGGATQRDAIARLELAVGELADEVHKIKSRLDDR
jgi:tetrahydromethanopterin S-methyltransferase subunit G